MLSAAEFLSSWSSIEVVAVSLIVALLQIQKFALFIVGDACDSINSILVKLDKPLHLDSVDKCFDVSWTVMDTYLMRK